MTSNEIQMLQRANEVYQWHGKIKNNSETCEIIVPSSVIAEEVNYWAKKNHLTNRFKVSTWIKGEAR